MDVKISNIKPSDYDLVISKLNEWWGGRNMQDMLPKLFFKHFNSTSFIIKDATEVLGFLIGFKSQEILSLGYVHFIGVNPNFRNKNIGKKLYKVFFNEMKNQNILEIECVTSPNNQISIEFHKKLGFVPQKGNRKNINDIPYFENYDGENEHRILFRKKLE